MNKAFVREDASPEAQEPDDPTPVLPAGSKNYMTPAGFERLRAELHRLVTRERVELTGTIRWAAGNGDRSENGDYIYGKKRLREIDRRIRFLTRRLENAEVIDPATREGTEQIFFGATVTLLRESGTEQTVAIVGLDETDPTRGHISWISPLARALLRAREGETVTLHVGDTQEDIEVLAVRYRSI